MITPLLIEINDLKTFSVKKCVKNIYLYGKKIEDVTLRNKNSAHVIAFL